MTVKVLIDVSYLAHRAKYSLKDLEHEDFAAGVIYGLFEQLLTVCAHPKIESNQVHLFFDSNQSYRRRAYPLYKDKRGKNRTDEEWAQISVMKEQLNILRQEVFPDIGFRTYRQTGLESDDLIAQAAKQFDCKSVIITADGDMFQCITGRVHWFDPARDKYFDSSSFRKKYRIGPGRWLRVKCLAGCNTDTVAGIPGVGEKTAIKYILGNLPEHHKTFDAILNGGAIRLRNRDLVELPHKKTKTLKLEAPEYSVEKFFKWCKTFGIQSYLRGKRKEDWMNFFNNVFQARVIPSRKRGEKRGSKKRKRKLF